MGCLSIQRYVICDCWRLDFVLQRLNRQQTAMLQGNNQAAGAVPQSGAAIPVDYAANKLPANGTQLSLACHNRAYFRVLGILRQLTAARPSRALLRRLADSCPHLCMHRHETHLDEHRSCLSNSAALLSTETSQPLAQADSTAPERVPASSRARRAVTWAPGAAAASGQPVVGPGFGPGGGNAPLDKEGSNVSSQSAASRRPAIVPFKPGGGNGGQSRPSQTPPAAEALKASRLSSLEVLFRLWCVTTRAHAANRVLRQSTLCAKGAHLQYHSRS